MELDLNQEPLDQTSGPVTGFDSIWNDLEATHLRIEERIRHLEAVTHRARQRQSQRWRRGQEPVGINNIMADMMITPSVQNDAGIPLQDASNAVQERTVILADLTAANAQTEGRMPGQEADGVAVQETMVGNRKTGKRNSSHLVAKALGVDPYIDEAAKSETGNFFDCNICLDMAKNPILTCCGHLFCWPCFYQVSFAYSNVRECPVCKGEVSERGITPIYGNQDVSSNRESKLKEAGLTVPPRPQARRIDGLRQQLISRGASSSTNQEIRRVINFNGATAADRTRSSVNQSHQELPSMETGDIQPNRRSRRLARMLVEGAASLSSLSSALNSAVGLVGDLDIYIYPQRPQHRRRSREVPDPLTTVAASNHLGIDTPDVAATNSAASASVSPLATNDGDMTAIIDSGTQTTDGSVQMQPSSSSSRNVGLPDNNRGSNGLRRRRLRR